MSITSNDLIAFGAVVLATATDLQHRRIPNRLTGAVSAIGLMAAAAGAGTITLGAALLGLAIGLCSMLPGYLLGATGGGDAKLMAALGAVLGPVVILHVALYTAIAGGVLAIVVAHRRRRLTATFAGAVALAGGSRRARVAVIAAGAVNRIPYGPAIAAGTMCAIALQ